RRGRDRRQFPGPADDRPAVRDQDLRRLDRQGVALRILRAVDTKSAILFVLVLVVCRLFPSQAALASVRARRTEIGTLRCIGWSTREIFTLILGELLTVGVLSGALGAVL